MEPQSATDLIKGAAANFRETLNDLLPGSRALSIAQTHIDTAELWALDLAKQPA